jgi:hypothetical protein
MLLTAVLSVFVTSLTVSLPRPTCQVPRDSPWKITVRSGAQRHPEDPSAASALGGDLCAAKESPGTVGRAHSR